VAAGAPGAAVARCAPVRRTCSAARRAAVAFGAVLVLPQPGHGVGQGCQLGQQGEQLLVLVATYEPGRGEQHGRGAQALAGARRRGNAAPQLPSGPVVLARGVGQRPAAATLDDPATAARKSEAAQAASAAAWGSVLALAWICSVALAAVTVACSQMRVRSPGVSGYRSSPMVLPRPPAPAAGAGVVPADRLDCAPAPGLLAPAVASSPASRLYRRSSPAQCWQRV